MYLPDSSSRLNLKVLGMCVTFPSTTRYKDYYNLEQFFFQLSRAHKLLKKKKNTKTTQSHMIHFSSQNKKNALDVR